MIRVGIAGIGFMGRIHYLAYQRLRGFRVAAIATRDSAKLAGDWRSTTGNFGPPGERFDLGSIARYESLDRMLADPAIDLVDICLPPAMHQAAATAAFKAGKHVLCEKPLALNARDADRMVAAARKADRLLLVGHVLPFFAEYSFALKTIHSGKYGKLLGANFKRVISEPTWLPDFYDPEKVGGPVIDLTIHDAHFIRVAAGMPQSVSSQGWLHGDVVDFVQTQFQYGPGGPAITASGGVNHQPGRGFTHGFEIYLERATLLYDFAVIDGQPVAAMPLTLLLAGGKVQRPALAAGDSITAFEAELKEAGQSIRNGQPSALLGGDLARDALVLCQRQIELIERDKAVRV